MGGKQDVWEENRTFGRKTGRLGGNRTFGRETGHLGGKQDVWGKTGRLGEKLRCSRALKIKIILKNKHKKTLVSKPCYSIKFSQHTVGGSKIVLKRQAGTIKAKYM